MSGDASPSRASLAIARRVLAREAPETLGVPRKVGASLQLTVARVSEALRDSIGDDGYQALLERALTQMEGAHPALKSMRTSNEGSIQLEAVAASVEKHGSAAVTAAIEALIAVLVDVLGRLIGEDMAMQIIDREHPTSPTRGGVTP